MTDRVIEDEASTVLRAARALDDAYAVAPAPLDRRAITDPGTIVEAMARDILAARRGGSLGLIDLTEHGWSLAQVGRYGAPAHDLAASLRFARIDLAERLRAREIEETMAEGLARELGGDAA